MGKVSSKAKSKLKCRPSSAAPTAAVKAPAPAKPQEGYCTESPLGVILNVYALPRSSSSGVDGIVAGAVKVRLKSAPVDGKANRELIEVIAEAFDIPRSRVEFKGGETSKNKRIMLRGASVAEFEAMLARLNASR